MKSAKYTEFTPSTYDKLRHMNFPHMSLRVRVIYNSGSTLDAIEIPAESDKGHQI